MSYFKVQLRQVPAQLEDIITGVCFDHGCTGVTEALYFSQSDLTYDPSITPTTFHNMDVFFDAKPEASFFEDVLSYDKGILISTVEEEHKDWLEEWKKGFEAFQLVGNYWIVPSWLKPPEECKNPIYIDPGMAFGTGTHATTKMASFFVNKLGQQHPEEIKNWTMLDVGTGTAILAILGKMRGLKSVTGIEIDPEARRVAKENILLNKISQVEIPDSLIEDLRVQYDVVVANIIDGVLIQIKSDLLRVLKTGGHLFLTGILEERDNYFFEKFIEKTPLKVIQRIEKDEWVGYWVQKIESSEE